MASKVAVNRLRKEYRCFEPPPFVRAAPLESNLQEWHYVLQGPPDSPYSGGLYHGKVVFPNEYPFKPPSIYMLTPNGRFETGRRLCLSMSDFHPESWVPAWSVATILTGVLSFFLENENTTGAVVTTLEQKRQLCAASAAWNAKDPTFKKLFPELVGGTLFEDPSKPIAPPVTPAPAPAPAPAPVPPPEVVEAEAEAEPEPEAEAAPGEGKNAAKNKKKREKERAKRLAAAGTGAGQDGAEAAEVGAVVDAAAAGLAAAAIAAATPAAPPAATPATPSSAIAIAGAAETAAADRAALRAAAAPFCQGQPCTLFRHRRRPRRRCNQRCHRRRSQCWSQR